MPFVTRLTQEGQSDILTLDEIKAWLKIEHELEDSILENLREAAAQGAYNLTQNEFEYKDSKGELVLQPIPFDVKLAILMHIAYLYQNRGDDPTTLPHNSVKLLLPYKKLVGL